MLLEARKLDKKFNGVYALKGADLCVRGGEIHGLIGENGAGKSTLIKILGGVYRADGGSLLWDGQKLSGALSPEESRGLGIRIIFQDNVLVPAFSGMENICLEQPYPIRHGLIRWKEMERAAGAKAEELGIRLDLKRPVAELTPPQRKCVEIVRAMMGDCRLLILDEPTASFSDKEAELLFSIVRKLKAKGTAVLYVSHRLEEILSLTDRVTVLKNGEVERTLETGTVTKEELVRLMSGREPQRGSARESRGQGGGTSPEEGASGGRRLEIRNLSSADGVVKDVNFTAEPGKISGLFGLCGCGRTELLECVFGCRKIKGGKILIGGEAFDRPSPDRAIARGMTFISEDRRGKGLVPAFSVEDNILLSSLDRFSRFGRFARKRAGARASEMIRSMKIACAGAGQPVLELSGGNQQKVVFSRALLTEPSVWLCDEPTQAVDVGTREEIHRILRGEADRGKTVVYVSSDLTELLETADTVTVMSAGRTVKTFENRGLTPEQVLACCYEAEEGALPAGREARA